MVGIALLAQVCAFLGDRARAPRLYQMLLPFERLHIVIGSAAVYYGPMARHLGLLAATMSQWDDAARHFGDAIRACEKLQSKPFLALSQHDYAAMLRARGGPGLDQAQALADQALATATQLGMKHLSHNARALRSELSRRA